MAQSTILADTGNGATFTYTGFSFKIKSIGGMTETLERIEASTLDTTDYKAYVNSDLKETPELNIEFLWDTFLTPPTVGGTPSTATVTFPLRTGEATAANLAGSAFVRELTYPTLQNGELQMGSMIVTFDGVTGPTYTKST